MHLRFFDSYNEDKNMFGTRYTRSNQTIWERQEIDKVEKILGLKFQKADESSLNLYS